MSDPKMIKKMAHKYVATKTSMRALAKEFGISYANLQRHFSEDLKEISPKLYEKVNKKKAANTEKSRRNFETLKKETVFHKVKKIFCKG